MKINIFKKFVLIIVFVLFALLLNSCSYNRSLHKTIHNEIYYIDVHKSFFHLYFSGDDEDSVFDLSLEYNNKFIDSYVPRIIDFEFNIKDTLFNTIKPQKNEIWNTDFIIFKRDIGEVSNVFSKNLSDLASPPYEFLRFLTSNEKKYNFQFKDRLPFYVELNVKIAFKDSVYKNTSIYLIE